MTTTTSQTPVTRFVDRFVQNVETVIPGHYNGVMTWNDFKDGADFYRDFLATVQDGMKAGKSASEVEQAYRLPEKYKGFQLDPQRVRANVQAIFSELKK